MYEILAIMALNLATVHVLARRLHAIDPDLSTWQYARKILRAQVRPGTLLSEPLGRSDLTRKPDGTPVHAAFVRHVGIAVASGFLSIVTAAALVMTSGAG